MFPDFVFVLVGVVHAVVWAFVFVDCQPELHVYEIDGELRASFPDLQQYAYRDRIVFPRLKFPFICSSVVVNGMATYIVFVFFKQLNIRSGFNHIFEFIDNIMVTAVFVGILSLMHMLYVGVCLFGLVVCYDLDEAHATAIRIAHMNQQIEMFNGQEQDLNSRKESIQRPDFLQNVRLAHERDLEKGLKSIHTRLAALRNETRPIRIRQAEVLVVRLPIDLVGRVFEFL